MDQAPRKPHKARQFEIEQQIVATQSMVRVWQAVTYGLGAIAAVLTGGLTGGFGGAVEGAGEAATAGQGAASGAGVAPVPIVP